jgi:hypothetical protein
MPSAVPFLSGFLERGVTVASRIRLLAGDEKSVNNDGGRAISGELAVLLTVKWRIRTFL